MNFFEKMKVNSGIPTYSQARTDCKPKIHSGCIILLVTESVIILFTLARNSFFSRELHSISHFFERSAASVFTIHAINAAKSLVSV